MIFPSRSLIDYMTDILRVILPANQLEGIISASAIANRLETDIAEVLWSVSWMTARGWIESDWNPATGKMYVRKREQSKEPSRLFQAPRHIERWGRKRATKTVPGHPREHALKIRSKDSQPPICASPSPHTQTTAPLGLVPLIPRIESLDLEAPDLPNTPDPLNSPRDQFVKGTSGR